MYSGKHEQEPAPFCSLQMALAPQGEGEHGLKCSTAGVRICGLHCMNGSPKYPVMHAQFGV